MILAVFKKKYFAVSGFIKCLGHFAEYGKTVHNILFRPDSNSLVGDVIALNRSHFRATERHLLHGITRCYLLPDTGERAPL